MFTPGWQKIEKNQFPFSEWRVNRVKYAIELLHKLCIVRENVVGPDAILSLQWLR